MRDHSDLVENVTHLEYEVYAGVVETSIREIVDEASEKWPVLSVAVEHRSGVVGLGEASVAVAVATGAPRGCVRGGPFHHRRVEDARPDLEERALARRRRVESGLLGAARPRS